MEDAQELIAQIQELLAVYGLRVLAALAILFFGRIAAGLAHEVRNPLGGIRGAGELLFHRAQDDKTRETADLIAASEYRTPWNSS